MGIGSIGFTEILVIAVIVLIFFGPQRLPEVTRALGGAMREFRRSMNEIQRELEEVDRARKWKAAGTPDTPGATGSSPGSGGQELAPPIAGAATGSPPHATVPVEPVPAAPLEEKTGEAPAVTADTPAAGGTEPEPVAAEAEPETAEAAPESPGDEPDGPEPRKPEAS